MLKIQINKGNIQPKYTEVECSHTFSEGVLHFSGTKPHGFRDGDVAYLRWDSGMEYSYPVNVLDATGFTIDIGVWYKIGISNVVNEDGGTFLCFAVDMPVRADRSGVKILAYIRKEDSPESIGRICNGQYYVKDNFFLYQYPSDTKKNTQIGIKIDDTEKTGWIGFEGNCHDSYRMAYIDETVDVLNKDVYIRMNPDCCIFHVYRKEGNIKISMPISESFGTNLFAETEHGEGYIQKRVEESINPILDYEKQPFELYFINNSKNGVLDEQLDMANSLTYKLHFRERDEKNNWVVSGESAAWHSYSIDGDKLTKKEGKEDTLSSITFNDEDIFAETAALKKSFLRLSFYDTPDRKTQSLLFYSTMFFDMSKLKKDAISRIGAEDTKGTNVEFTCQNKFISNVSSEGFYLYLFPKIVQDGETTIYMKAEFNHAKYGYTIPFILPCEFDKATSVYEILDPEDKFPVAYITSKGGTYTSNMKQLSEDLYVKVNIKYNEEKNCYVWYFPYSNLTCEEGNIVLELFEPKING